MITKKAHEEKINNQTDKLISYIKEHNDKIIPLSNKGIRSITNSSIYSEVKESVQAATFRDDNIIPVLVKYPRVGNASKLPYAFRSLSDVEYDSYDFTGKNFRELSDVQVRTVKDRISDIVDSMWKKEKQSDREISKNKIRYAYIFLCATYFSMPAYYLPFEAEYFSGIMIKPKEEVIEMMNDLVDADLFANDGHNNFISLLRPDSEPVSKEEAIAEFEKYNLRDFCKLLINRQYKGKNGIDNQEKDGIIENGITYCEYDKENKPSISGKKIQKKDVTSLSNNAGMVHIEGIDSEFNNDLLSGFINGYRQQLAELNRLQTESKKFEEAQDTIVQLYDECNKKDQQISELQDKGDAYDVLAKRCSELKQRIQILEDGSKRYAEDLKDYKAFREEVAERTDRAVKRMSLKLMDIITDFTHGRIDDADARIQTQDVAMDMVKTINNMVAMRK